MRRAAGAWILVVVALAGAGLCVRLGFWQLSRLEEKRVANRTLERALASAPVDLGASGFADSLLGRRVRIQGRYDVEHSFVLRDRTVKGRIGVVLVTPLVLDDSSAALVIRGWLPSPDGVRLDTQVLSSIDPWPLLSSKPWRMTVVGIVERPPAPRGGGRPAASPPGSAVSESWQSLDLDAVRKRVPYRLQDFVVRRVFVPSESVAVGGEPRALAAVRLDEDIHRSYAAQWFFFALLCLAAPILFLRRRA